MMIEIEEDAQNDNHINSKPKRPEERKNQFDVFLAVKLFGEIFSKFLAEND